MKKIILLLPVIVVFSCKQKDKKITPQPGDSIIIKKDTMEIVPVTREMVDSNRLYDLSAHIVTVMKNSNYHSLAQYFHPDGVRFSPYTYIDTAEDRVISRDQLLSLAKKKNKVNWNSDWGGEEPETLTLDQYFKRFVYDVDFLKAPVRTMNRYGIRGSDINNIEEVFPGANTVEYFFPGFDKESAGMDFRGLNLVFRLYQSKPLLVAITHNEWTP